MADRRASPGITPVFVLGTARSGTTWLANLLIDHPDIVGMAAAEHQGIHESHLLDHTRYALPGTMPRETFADRYAAEDYFKLAGVPREELIAASPPVADVVTFFTVLMGLAARRAGARCLLEKTPKHAIYADALLDRFPDARFVVITRGFAATMRSQLGKFANPNAGWLRQRIEKAARYASDMKALRRLLRRAPDRVVRVAYEDLLRDTAGETGRVLRFLGLAERPLASRFAADSSFGPGRAGAVRGSAAERAVLAVSRALFALVPLAVWRPLRERRDRREAHVFPKYHLL